MQASVQPPSTLRDDASVMLRARIDAWLGEYADCLDSKRLEEWPDFFEEECFYTIVPQENAALGLELGLVRCESRNMLKDRAFAITKTALHGPRDVRHFFSGLVLRDASSDLIRTECNFLVVETLNDALPRIFAVGRSYDQIRRLDDGFRFKSRRCVYTSNLIPNTLTIPI